MEMKFSPNDLHLASSNMKRGNQKDQHNELETSQHEENDISSPLNMRNLSKIILPPLGASSYNQNQIKSKGRIISPMDSRYRYVVQEITNITKNGFFFFFVLDEWKTKKIPFLFVGFSGLMYIFHVMAIYFTFIYIKLFLTITFYIHTYVCVYICHVT